MTYDTSRIQDDRKPVTVCDLTLDFCANTYGVAPCTATGAVGTECYNTYNTCQDVPNYVKTEKTYRFYQPISNFPAGEFGYPCVKGSPTFTPTMIDPKGSLGRRGVVTVNFTDFADDDIFTDPYVKTRPYNPESQGTFFGKLKARNLYFQDRLMRVKQGYINEPFSFNDFDDRLYIIDTLDFANKDTVTLTGKDILKLADDKKAFAPLASTGTLKTAYTVGDTTIALQTGEGADYKATGKVAIGNNVLVYTGISTDTLTGVTGGQNGSTDANASETDSVQQCIEYFNKNVVDIIHELLNTYAGIDEKYLPYDAGLAIPTGVNDEWDDEKDIWLNDNNLDYIITEHASVYSLIENICKQNLLYIWFDERAQKVKLKAIAPPLNNNIPTTLSDSSNIIKNTIKVKDNIKERISQIWVHYDIIDIFGNKKKSTNYNNTTIIVDTEFEGVNSYEPSILVIYADWLKSKNAGIISALAGRTLSKYSSDPKIVTFDIDAKDAADTGDLLIVDSHHIQSPDGSNQLSNISILKRSDNHDRQTYKITGEAWEYGLKRAGYIAPNSMGDYTVESSANQNAYGFISDNSGLYSNGDKGHLIA